MSNLPFPYYNEPRQLSLSLWDPTKLYRWPLFSLHSLWFLRKIQLAAQRWSREQLVRKKLGAWIKHNWHQIRKKKVTANWEIWFWLETKRTVSLIFYEARMQPKKRKERRINCKSFVRTSEREATAPGGITWVILLVTRECGFGFSKSLRRPLLSV